MKKLIPFAIVFFLIFIITAAFAQTKGVKKKSPPRHEYGNVVINNSSTKNKIAPVVYNHWLHRAKYTCRLCHVDIGFEMKAGGTGITEKDNKNGLYCGACHNGKEAFAPEEKTPNNEVKKNCDRCHSYGKAVAFEKDFYQFTKDFPAGRFGNGIDWLKAEEKGLVKLKDHIAGISIKRNVLRDPQDIYIKARKVGMPDIIFSHKKHSVWNGCEMCHPDIFGIKRGATKYSMQDIFAGKYCGACHGKVSFPLLDCQRCHTKGVK
ncbi:MAG: hypothetical protein HY756_07530 [Nitrospirae bacterium]|nr:hypothetical protein [Nitrospirota bacterium]